MKLNPSLVSVVVLASVFTPGPAYGTPFTNATLDTRQCAPAAVSCDGRACCAGLFCSLTAPRVCSQCIGSAGICSGIPCCVGLSCGLKTRVRTHTLPVLIPCLGVYFRVLSHLDLWSMYPSGTRRMQ
ncbi:hypothetical protein R3P38DRAFT_933896 [Favolaschia claudopus]|uniref:Secreted protein n=1 Tax=Favolaschia claudopus TaxID=2862362 RepID=A0AAW0BRA5_9AGAR